MSLRPAPAHSRKARVPSWIAREGKGAPNFPSIECFVSVCSITLIVGARANLVLHFDTIGHFVFDSLEGTKKNTHRAQNYHPLLSLVMLSSGAGRPLIVSGVSKDLYTHIGRLYRRRIGDPRLFLMSPAGRARGAAHRARGFDLRRRALAREYFFPKTRARGACPWARARGACPWGGLEGASF